MYAPWMRVFRSAALRNPRTRLATRPARHFHASAQARATPAPTPADEDPNKGKDDSSKRGKDDNDERAEGSSEANVKENLFGEGGLNGNGESHARGRKRLNGSLRSRTLRNRTPEELPPVQLPSGFKEKHIYRHGDRRKHIERLLEGGFHPYEKELLIELLQSTQERYAQAKSGKGEVHIKTTNERRVDKAHTTGDLRNHNQSEETPEGDSEVRLHHEKQSGLDIFDAAAWDESSVLNVLNLELGGQEQPDALARIFLRGELLVDTACIMLKSATRRLGHDENSELFQKVGEIAEKRGSPHLARMLLMLSDRQPSLWPSTESLAKKPNLRDDMRALEYVLATGHPYVPELGLAHNDLLHESISSIRSDFAVECPKYIRMAELKRPVTILNFPYYQGSSWPSSVVEDIASTLKADVLHLTAHDIALVIGSYLGQEATRAPGPISLLGYKAAENSGRVRQESSDEDDELRVQPWGNLIFRAAPDMRKDTKKRGSLMEQFGWADSSREKSDDAWDELKTNAALEELLHSADLETSEQRPLIVHLHDFNALNLETECGSSLVTRIRKSIDTLWSEGRKVVLVGTCSSLEAPRAYMQGLKQLGSAERLITFNTAPERMIGSDLPTLMKNDYLAENTTNIKTMLETLLIPNYDEALPRVDFDLGHTEEQYRLKSVSESVLPLAEVHRIAKTMIGLRDQQPELFDQSILEETVFLIKRIDEAKSYFAKSSKETVSKDKDEEMDFGPFGGPPRGNHEAALLSGLVNSKDIRTTFKDVHAPRATIDSIKMLTQLSLLRPEAFSYGVLATERIPGCLLYGPPGTGKTLLAKAVAKESGANMIEVSGASINNMYVGESEKNVKALFKLAKKKEPLVIFIDEADALLGARGGRSDGAGRRETINQFLKEWDGMDQMKAFIMVATNRPFDLDEAVLRRLPRKLLIDLPLEQDRAAILKIHLKDEVLDDTVSFEKIAKQTPLYSGSDLKNVCVAAAMAVVKEEMEAEEKHTGSETYAKAPKRVLSQRHFDKALSEISASVSEDMQTMNAIKKFDEKYGDGSAKRKKKPGMGFHVASDKVEEARVRTVERK